MAKFFYANTWHPELFTLKGDKSNVLGSVDYEDKTWAVIPSECSAYVYLPNDRLKDFYLSFEYIPFPIQHCRTASSFNIRRAGDLRVLTLKSGVFLDTDSTCRITFINTEQECRYYGVKSDEEAFDILFSGDFRNYSRTVYSYTKLESSLGLDAGKVLVHIKSDTFTRTHDTTTNVGTAAKETNEPGGPLRFGCYGVGIRNVIISEDPIQYSDTLKEVSVDSIHGENWYSSGGKTYTEQVNASATVNLNRQSLFDAANSLDARKFAFAGTVNRQGDRINALEVKRGYEAHQNIMDMGEHVFGSAWDIGSKSNLPDTLTITTRKVVGK